MVIPSARKRGAQRFVAPREVGERGTRASRSRDPHLERDRLVEGERGLRAQEAAAVQISRWGSVEGTASSICGPANGSNSMAFALFTLSPSPQPTFTNRPGVSGLGTNHAGAPFSSRPRRAPGAGGLLESMPPSPARLPPAGSPTPASRRRRPRNESTSRRRPPRRARWSGSRGSCRRCGCPRSRSMVKSRSPKGWSSREHGLPQRRELFDLQGGAERLELCV